MAKKRAAEEPAELTRGPGVQTARTGSRPRPDPCGRRSVVGASASRARLPRPSALFEQAMEALQRHELRRRCRPFPGLLDQHPGGSGSLLDRARVYLGLCERELAGGPSRPGRSRSG